MRGTGHAKPVAVGLLAVGLLATLWVSPVSWIAYRVSEVELQTGSAPDEPHSYFAVLRKRARWLPGPPTRTRVVSRDDFLEMAREADRHFIGHGGEGISVVFTFPESEEPAEPGFVPGEVDRIVEIYESHED